MIATSVYNATAYTPSGVQAVQIDDQGRVVRASGDWHPTRGTSAFDAVWSEKHPWAVVVRDGARGYLNAGLPRRKEVTFPKAP